MNTHGTFFDDEPAQLVPSGIFSGGDFLTQHCSNNCDWTQSSNQSLNFSRIDDGQVPFFGHVAVPQFQCNGMGTGNREIKPEPKSLIECLNYNPAPVSHSPPAFYGQQNACMVPMENQQKAIDYAIAEDQIQILQSALQAEMNDVQEACKILQIPSEPCLWTKADARAWLEWTCHQYNLTNCVDLRKFDCDGFELTMMDEMEFRERAPNCGDLLWSVLYIWKTSGGVKPEIDMGGYGCQPQQTRCQSISSGSEYSVGSNSHQEFHGFGGFTVQTTSFSTVRPMSVFAASPAASTGADSGFDTEHVSEDGDGHAEVDLDESMDGSGGHTQLWQFLKEMLSKPERYVSAIRWLDRSKGIFKIEDSVRVAKCWGKRKNRPAMNYDKLSRSIRQYYKKGIMKKTERSQRLVYQYCAAYAQ